MATTAINNIKRSVKPATIFPSAKALVDSSVSFNQGDLIALVSGKLKAVALDADTQTFLGVATVTVVSGKLASPYVTAVDASQGTPDIPGPVFGVVANFKLKSGDTFTEGAVVYPYGAGDAQTISSSSNSGARYPIGIFAGATVTAGSSSTGDVYVGVNNPDGVLKGL